MSVRYRADRDCWEISWSDERGRRKRRLLRSENAARTIEAEIRRQQIAIPIAAPGLRLDEAAELWQRQIGGAASTKETRRLRLRPILRQLGSTELLDVTELQLHAWRNARALEVAPSTLAKESANLHQLLEWCRTKRYIHHNPAARLDRKEIISTAAREITVPEERDILSRSQGSKRLRILLALDAGLRAGETASIRRRDWNPEERTLLVYSSKTHTTRTLPLTIRLSAALEEQAGELTPDAPIIGRNGKQIHKPSAFLRYTHAAFRFHDLRHTFATRLRRVAEVEAVRELLGHAPRSTTDRYIHPSAEELRAAIGRMEEENAKNLDTPGSKS